MDQGIDSSSKRAEQRPREHCSARPRPADLGERLPLASPAAQMSPLVLESLAPAATEQSSKPESALGRNLAFKLAAFVQGKQEGNITVEEVNKMGEPLTSAVKGSKPPASRRPLTQFFRRRSSSSPSSRRNSISSEMEGGEIVYASAPPDSSALSRLTSPSMPALSTVDGPSSEGSLNTGVAAISLAAPLQAVRAFARRPDSTDSIATSEATSSRPSIMTDSSTRTSETSYNSTSQWTRRATESSAPPSPAALREIRRVATAMPTQAQGRPGPTPVAGSNRSLSNTTRPLKGARTSSRLSFSAITQSLGATAPRPPPDPATAARLRTLPRLLSYSSSPPVAVPTASPPLASENTHRAAELSPAYREHEAASYWSPQQLAPALAEAPAASTSAVPIGEEPAVSTIVAPESLETDEDTDDEENDAFRHPELAEMEPMEEGAELPRTTPRPSRMQMDMPIRSTPDRFVVTPVTTPRSREASSGLRGTPQMPGWTTFATTPGLTPFTARPSALASSDGSYFDLRPLTNEPEDMSPNSPEMVTASTSPLQPSSPLNRPALLTRRSRSLVNLLDTAVQPAAPSMSLPVPATSPSISPTRRRSMYELREPPPDYNPLDAAPIPGWYSKRRHELVLPRDDEGCERLPVYTCDVHIEGYVPRKMEFVQPGIQAGNRAWRKQYIVLHGTYIKIFKADPSIYPVPDESKAQVDARRLSVSSTTSYTSSMTSSAASTDDEDGRPVPLHVHEGRYGEVEGESNEGFTTALLHSHLLPGSAGHNACLRSYSLQGAESGLAADYLKRKHVVRVRAEGEQFLIQAKDDRGVIDWIECLQAATNVAMDLDTRPLPKFITLPRRRRRRRRPEDQAAADAATAAANGTADIPVPRDGGRMHDMLAEEQEAYMRS